MMSLPKEELPAVRVLPAAPIDKKKLPLFQKILGVQAGIMAVAKDGTNSFHKYSYTTEAELLYNLKPLFTQYGLVVWPSVIDAETGKEGAKNWARVRMGVQVIDAETGESLLSESIGFAEDTSDKAIYKAITGATKYFYLKNFIVATDDDPEKHPVSWREEMATADNTEKAAKIADCNKIITNVQGHPPVLGRKPETPAAEEECRTVYEEIKQAVRTGFLKTKDMLAITGYPHLLEVFRKRDLAELKRCRELILDFNQQVGISG